MKQGFTLIEILIVLLVLAVMMVAGTDMLLSVMQNAYRAMMQNEVRQNASLILQDMASSIRSAGCVAWSGAGSGDVVLTTYFDSGCTVSKDTYKFVWDPVFPVMTAKVFKNNLQRSSGSISTISCSSDCQSNCANGISVTGTSGTALPLTITLTTQSTVSATSSYACAQVTLTDTITPRSC